MQAITLLALVLAIIISLSLGFTFLAEMLFLALVTIILFFFLAKIASGLKQTGKSLSKGTMADLEKAKGQSPKAIAEFEKMFGTVGAKTGEIAWAKDKETWKSPDLAGRIGAGAKNLLDGLGRLFK